MDSHIAVLDRDGVIMMVNESWRCFGLENGTESGTRAKLTQVGVNYLDICQNSIGEWSDEAAAACDGIQAVLVGQQPGFTLEYPYHSPHQRRRFFMRVTPLDSENRGVVIAHIDITQSKIAEYALQKANCSFAPCLRRPK